MKGPKARIKLGVRPFGGRLCKILNRGADLTTGAEYVDVLVRRRMADGKMDDTKLRYGIDEVTIQAEAPR